MAQIYALLAVLLFLVSHAQVKILSHFPVYEVVFFRAAGILILSIPSILFLRQPLFGNDKKNLFLRGLFGTIAIFCYFTTLQKLPFSSAVVLAQTAPLFAIFFAQFILSERPKPFVYLFFAFAFVGIYLIKDPQIQASWYYLLGLLGAALAALAYNYVRKLRVTDSPLVVLTWFQFVLFPVSVVPLLYKGFKVPELQDLKAIFLLAVFSFLAQVCLTLAYHKGAVAKAANIKFLSIPLSLLVGYFVFQESIGVKSLFGIALVFMAVLGSSGVLNWFVKRACWGQH